MYTYESIDGADGVTILLHLLHQDDHHAKLSKLPAVQKQAKDRYKSQEKVNRRQLDNLLNRPVNRLNPFTRLTLDSARESTDRESTLDRAFRNLIISFATVEEDNYGPRIYGLLLISSISIHKNSR